MSRPEETADSDVISRRIVAENARLERGLDVLLTAQGVSREALSAMAELGAALPPDTKEHFEQLVEAELAALPDSPQLSLESLSRPEHATIASRGLTLLRA